MEDLEIRPVIKYLSDYDEWVEKAGHYAVGNNNITGFLLKIDCYAGVIKVIPSIVGVGDYLKVEKKSLALHLFLKGAKWLGGPWRKVT